MSVQGLACIYDLLYHYNKSSDVHSLILELSATFFLVSIFSKNFSDFNLRNLLSLSPIFQALRPSNLLFISLERSAYLFCGLQIYILFIQPPNFF